MYECVMAERYARLPAAVQRFHRLAGAHVLHGWVETAAPATALARVLAYGLGSPRQGGSGPIRFELDAAPAAETWTRRFPTRTMKSQLRLVAGAIEETLGPARLRFDLLAVDGGLKMELRGLKFLGLPCPRWLLPRIVAEEHGDDDRLHFRVAAALPLVGVVASYRGHLELGPAAAP